MGLLLSVGQSVRSIAFTTTVGVATGRYTVDELTESGAHIALTDLSDTKAVAELLLA